TRRGNAVGLAILPINLLVQDPCERRGVAREPPSSMRNARPVAVRHHADAIAGPERLTRIVLHDGDHPSTIEAHGQLEPWPAIGIALDRIADNAAQNRAADDCRGLADRKSTRLNSSHVAISYAVFCLK